MDSRILIEVVLMPFLHFMSPPLPLPRWWCTICPGPARGNSLRTTSTTSTSSERTLSWMPWDGQGGNLEGSSGGEAGTLSWMPWEDQGGEILHDPGWSMGASEC